MRNWTYPLFPSAQTNAAAGDRFTYTGREWDAEIGLYYYRARFFDPQLGRFTSQDPIGFAAGDPNLYRYVANQVLIMVDPFGETMVDRAVHHKEELKTAPIKSYVACLASEAYFTVAFAAIGLAPDITDIVDLFVDCMAEAGAPGAGTAARVTDKVGDLARRGDDLVDGLKAGGKAVGKSADGANDAAKALNKAGDAGKAAKKGGETAATKAGRQAHKDWDPGEGFEKEVRLPSGKRADGVNMDQKHVKELKPNNPRAVKRGEKQVEKYRQELQEKYGGTWTSSVETY